MWKYPDKAQTLQPKIQIIFCYFLLQEDSPSPVEVAPLLSSEIDPALLEVVSLLNKVPWGYFFASSAEFIPSVMTNSLWPHELQNTRLPCPSPSPGACSNSCPFSQWCHPTISSCVIPFSFCPQSFPVSGYFPIGWLFSSAGQSIRASASASVLPISIQGWLSLGLTSWSPCYPRDSQESSPTPQSESIIS